MKSGIKKKFLDILFDNDEYIDRKAKEQESTKETSKESTIDAKEVLYKKSKNSAFINLQETINNAKEEPKAKSSYEMSSQISPMFGLVNEKRKKTNTKVENEEPVILKQENSHLDIVTSPIYGYGKQAAEHYLPSENDNFDNTDEYEELPPFDEETYHDEEFDDLMEYVDNDDHQEYDHDDDIHEDYDEHYEHDDEHYDHDNEHYQQEEDYHEQDDEDNDYEHNQDEDDDNEYLGYYKANKNSHLDDQDSKVSEDEIPYYDEKIYSDDYDVEEISLFDTDEDE